MAVSAKLDNMLRIKEKITFPPNSIRSLRKARDMTMEELGAAIGTDASTVNKLEKSAMRLTDKWLPKLSEALHVAADDILRDPGITATDQTQAELRAADVAVPTMRMMPMDLPVRGTAAGSHLRGAFLEGEVVDFARRPPSLVGAMNAYGLYIVGESMVPEHNPGDLRIIHPDRPPRIGDSVVVQIQLHKGAPVESTIGRLVRRTEKAIVIGKHNPKAEVELRRETVISVHKVLTDNDLFGI